MATAPSVIVETVHGSSWFAQCNGLVVESLPGTFRQCVMVQGYTPDTIVADIKVLVLAPEGEIIHGKTVCMRSDFISFSMIYLYDCRISAIGLYHYEVYCDGELVASYPYQISTGTPAGSRMPMHDGWDPADSPEDTDDEEPLSEEENDDSETAMDIISVLNDYRFYEWTSLQLDDTPGSGGHCWTLEHSETPHYVVMFDADHHGSAFEGGLIITEYDSNGNIISHRGPAADFVNGYLVYDPVAQRIPYDSNGPGLQVVWVNDLATGKTWLATRNHVERMGRLLPSFIDVLVSRV